jgi:acyl carrier protein
MDGKTIENKIQAIVAEQLKMRGLRIRVKNTDSLIGAGILDSLSALELVAELEKVFNITISPEEMTESNFGSVVKITNFISVKTKGS